MVTPCVPRACTFPELGRGQASKALQDSPLQPWSGTLLKSHSLCSRPAALSSPVAQGQEAHGGLSSENRC